MSALLVLAALVLDWMLGEPRRWHPLVGFGAMAKRLENCLHGGDASSAPMQRLRGVLALLLAVGPATALCALLACLPYAGSALSVTVLYFCLGHRSLREHAQRVYASLRDGRLAEARRSVGMMVSRDTADMDAARVAGATVESVLENGNDAVFGAVFWFLLLGAPGALFYRLVNTLDAMWGYRTPRYLYFGWAAARLDDVLNFIPARLTALAYALAGRTRAALSCWRIQAAHWESPNAGPVMASGAGSLGVLLGGPAFYHGQWKQRPPLGAGAPPVAADIPRALALLLRTLALWLAAIAGGAWLHA